MQRTDSLEKTLIPGKIKDRRRRGWQRMMMVGWHHRLNGHEFEQDLGDGDGQGGLACCSPWGCKESDTTEWMNWTGLTETSYFQPYMQTCTPHTMVGQAQNNHNRHSCSKKGETRGCISTIAEQFCAPAAWMAGAWTFWWMLAAPSGLLSLPVTSFVFHKNT